MDPSSSGDVAMTFQYKPLTPGQIKNRKRWRHYGVMGSIIFARRALSHIESLEWVSYEVKAFSRKVDSQLVELHVLMNQQVPK